MRPRFHAGARESIRSPETRRGRRPAAAEPWPSTGARGSIDGVDEASLVVAAIAFVTILVLLAGVALLYARAVVKAEHGHALVVSRPGRDEVRFGSSVVLPLVHRAEPIDLRTKTVLVDRRGKQSITCRDGVRADVGVTAHLRVNRTAEDVLKVAQSVGCARAGDPAVLEGLFAGKLSEAIKTVAAHLDFEQLHRDRQAFKDEVLQLVGADLSGYVIDDLVVDHLEQTPIELLDPNNLLDAQGMRRIVERTSQEKLRRNELELEAERQLQRRRLELEELVIELERVKADALSRFREATGRELGEEQLRSRIEDGLRAAVEQVLDERERRASPKA